MSDMRNILAKERDKYMSKNKTKDQYERNQLEAAFIAGWCALENAIKEICK